MPSEQLPNPLGAYGYAADFGRQTLDCKVGATAVAANNVVAFDANGNVVPGTVATASQAIGVSLDAGTAGQIVRVVVAGFAAAVSTAAIAAGAIGSPGAAGAVAAASATIGSNICSVVVGNAGAGAITVFVAKM